jgi:hypothetical protein
VTFSGTLLNPSTTQGVPNKPVVIRAYGTDSTCTGAYAEIGPTLTLNKSGEYTRGDYSISSGVPENAHDGTIYYVKAFSTFDDLTVESDCVGVRVTHDDAWSITLSITPSVIYGSPPVTMSGTLSNLGPSSEAGRPVVIDAYWTDETCAEPPSYSFAAVTTAGGAYTTGPLGTGAPPGDYYYKAKSMGAESACEHFTILPATVTMTFDVTEPYGAVDQWENVWTHRYTITLDNQTHTFTGTGVPQFGPGGVTEGTGETITGSLGDHSISYVATRTYDGRTWTLTNAPYNTEVLAVTNPPVSWDIDVKITEPVLVP